MTDTQTPAAPAAPAFDWNALLPPVEAPAQVYAAGTRFTVDSIPAPLRQRAETSLHDSVKAISAAVAAGKKVENVPPQWKLQPTGALDSRPMADELNKLFRKYAQYRPDEKVEFYQDGCPLGQITCRSAVVVYGTQEQITADARKDEKKRVGFRPIPAGSGIEPGVYVRYAFKPLEKRNSGK